MDIIARLEAEFKTLDEENPILFNIEDFILALQRIGIEAFGEDTIAGYDGNDGHDVRFPYARHKFSIRSKVNGKWKCLTIVNAYAQWASDGRIIVFDIEED